VKPYGRHDPRSRHDTAHRACLATRRARATRSRDPDRRRAGYYNRSHHWTPVYILSGTPWALCDTWETGSNRRRYWAAPAGKVTPHRYVCWRLKPRLHDLTPFGRKACLRRLQRISRIDADPAAQWGQIYRDQRTQWSRDGQTATKGALDAHRTVLPRWPGPPIAPHLR
jgi:hypothetical protein